MAAGADDGFPVPADEGDRLRALRRLEILDTEPENSYDDIAQLAALVCETPCGAISLIDADRQWFKARHGFEIAALDRASSLCAHAIMRSAPMVVEDAINDALWSQHPVVRDTHVRFYAGTPLRSDGHTVGTLCVLDMRPRKLSARRLRSLEALGHQVERLFTLRVSLRQQRELHERLAASMAQLSGAYRERVAMMSAVSHDVKSPLAAIRIMTEVLDERADDISTTQRRDLIHRIRLEARRTEGTLGDLVTAERVGSGLVMPKRALIDLAPPIRAAVGELADDMHTVRLGTLDGDLQLVADSAQVERILDNLISNAQRHTPPGCTITVAAVGTPEAVTITVADDGPGLPEHLHEAVFEAYVRGDDAQRRPGSGLGLYLVRQFAEFHGGTAHYERGPAGGAMFVVALPRQPAD